MSSECQSAIWGFIEEPSNPTLDRPLAVKQGPKVRGFQGPSVKWLIRCMPFRYRFDAQFEPSNASLITPPYSCISLELY